MKRRIAYTTAACTAAAVACSLIDRSSDFFGADDKPITLASTTSSATDLALTDDYVFYRTSEGIFRVPKEGGAAELFVPMSATHLASDGHHIIVWSNANTVLARRDDAGAAFFAVDASAQAVAVSDYDGATRIAFALASEVDDSGAFQQRNGVVAFATEAGIVGGGIKGSGDTRISIASREGQFYFTFGNTLAAETTPGGAPKDSIGNTSLYDCQIAGFQAGFPPDELIVDPALDAGVSALMIDNAENGVHVYAATPACCYGLPDCEDVPPFPADQHTLTLYSGTIYRLKADGTVARYPVSDVAKNAGFANEYILVDGGVHGTYPVADGKSLFFVSGTNKIQRLTLPP